MKTPRQKNSPMNAVLRRAPTNAHGRGAASSLARAAGLTIAPLHIAGMGAACCWRTRSERQAAPDSPEPCLFPCFRMEYESLQTPRLLLNRALAPSGTILTPGTACSVRRAGKVRLSPEQGHETVTA